MVQCHRCQENKLLPAAGQCPTLFLAGPAFFACSAFARRYGEDSELGPLAVTTLSFLELYLCRARSIGCTSICRLSRRIAVKAPIPCVDDCHQYPVNASVGPQRSTPPTFAGAPYPEWIRHKHTKKCHGFTQAVSLATPLHLYFHFRLLFRLPLNNC